MYEVSVGDLQGGSLPVPDDYVMSPMEIYASEPEYDPYYMAEHGAYGLTAEEAKGWFKKNWKWCAIGAGGLVAVGLVIKFVL